jgi:hypothetical protein
MNRTRLGLAAVLTAGLAAASPSAIAGSPHTVDPASVTPTLNPDFAPWTCWTAGTGITCRGGMDVSYDETTDLVCADQPVYVWGSERVVMTRWHDADGRATRTELHTDVDDHLSLVPGVPDPAVALTGHWQKHYVYPVPGDASARVLRETGSMLRVRDAGGDSLLQDTGLVQYVPDAEYEDVSVMHGIHDRFNGGPDLDAAICAGVSG